MGVAGGRRIATRRQQTLAGPTKTAPKGKLPRGIYNWPHGVTVSTLHSEASDRSPIFWRLCILRTSSPTDHSWPFLPASEHTLLPLLSHTHTPPAHCQHTSRTLSHTSNTRSTHGPTTYHTPLTLSTLSTYFQRTHSTHTPPTSHPLPTNFPCNFLWRFLPTIGECRWGGLICNSSRIQQMRAIRNESSYIIYIYIYIYILLPPWVSEWSAKVWLIRWWLWRTLFLMKTWRRRISRIMKQHSL